MKQECRVFSFLLISVVATNCCHMFLTLPAFKPGTEEENTNDAATMRAFH